LDRRLSRPQSRSGRGGEEKNSQPLPGIEPPIVQPVPQRYTTVISRNLKTILWTFLEKLIAFELAKIFPLFIKPECTLSSSQNPAIERYPEPVEFSLHLHILLL
jgi:hypothetical protein